MIKGAKRFAMSESNDANDSIFQSRRIMAGSHLDVNRAETSQQQFMTATPLDMNRAESSRQHVRALNTQFASWVQAQLLNHPDELWEDGVQDYLTHASNIMEKFSDVVNWLKANASKGGNSSTIGSHAVQSKPASDIKDNDSKIFQGKTGFSPAFTTTSFANASKGGNSSTVGSHAVQSKPASDIKDSDSNIFQGKTGFSPAATTTSFATSWSSGSVFNSQKPFSFGLQIPVNQDGRKTVDDGNQNSVPTIRDASNDADGEDEIEQPSSPSLKKTEEKGIIVVHEVKCKLYMKSTDPTDKDAWKDKGTGQLSIRCKEGVDKGTKESKPTILVRNDVGRIVLNALLYPGIKTNNMQKNSIAAIFHTSDENDGGDGLSVVARTFLIRTKGEEDRNKLAAAIQEHAPAASS